MTAITDVLSELVAVRLPDRLILTVIVGVGIGLRAETFAADDAGDASGSGVDRIVMAAPRDNGALPAVGGQVEPRIESIAEERYPALAFVQSDSTADPSSRSSLVVATFAEGKPTLQKIITSQYISTTRLADSVFLVEADGRPEDRSQWTQSFFLVNFHTGDHVLLSRSKSIDKLVHLWCLRSIPDKNEAVLLRYGQGTDQSTLIHVDLRTLEARPRFAVPRTDATRGFHDIHMKISPDFSKLAAMAPHEQLPPRTASRRTSYSLRVLDLETMKVTELDDEVTVEISPISSFAHGTPPFEWMNAQRILYQHMPPEDVAEGELPLEAQHVLKCANVESKQTTEWQRKQLRTALSGGKMWRDWFTGELRYRDFTVDTATRSLLPYDPSSSVSDSPQGKEIRFRGNLLHQEVGRHAPTRACASPSQEHVAFVVRSDDDDAATRTTLYAQTRDMSQPLKIAETPLDISLVSWIEDTSTMRKKQPDEGTASMWAGRATQPVPEGAKVTLELERTDWFLGENVLVHFVLENTSETPFTASWGGDYRGASRQLRFTITATDEAGQVGEDPDPWPMCLGGLGGPRQHKPGARYTLSLPLMRYCQIDKPGLYTIRATHDFGWKEGERKRPVGEAMIVFRMPNAEQAARLVGEMAELPDRSNAAWSERSTPYADFGCLRYPVYLDILVDRARDGDERSFDGLGRIPTRKATEQLVQLAGSLDTELALKAAMTLNERLPYPDSHYLPTRHRSFQGPQLSIRGRLVEQAWDESLVPEVRRLATKLLASEDLPTLATAAFMIVAVGAKEDAPAVIAAIERARNPTHKNRSDPTDNILNAPQPIGELLRAMDTLCTRGYALGEHVSGDAEILLYFHFLRNDPSPRPRRYRQFLEAFGTSSWFPIREAAVRSIPQPLPPEYRVFVLARLEDEDLGVCRAACTLAGESGDEEFIRPLLEIIATEHHEWLLREASDAARALGAGLDLLLVWADRLVEGRLYPLALDALQTVLDVPTGDYSGRTDLNRAARIELRQAWKEFLAQHAEEIRAGKRFKVDDPAVTPALVGGRADGISPTGPTGRHRRKP